LGRQPRSISSLAAGGQRRVIESGDDGFRFLAALRAHAGLVETATIAARKSEHRKKLLNIDGAVAGLAARLTRHGGEALR
jgi:hypothetical protein